MTTDVGFMDGINRSRSKGCGSDLVVMSNELGKGGRESGNTAARIENAIVIISGLF